MVAEVKQHELDVMVGAKPVELEGIAKNIAARTMSVCQAGQVLLTQEAFTEIKGKTNSFTPRGTRYVMVGLYQFKGVSEPQVIYAVGISIESLQPPPSSEKAKRLGGPKKVRSRARDRKVKEWIMWILPRWALINMIYIISLLMPYLMHKYPILNQIVRWLLGREE